MLLDALLFVTSTGVAATTSIDTRFGRIIGHVASVLDGHQCEEFLGIPFAEKPQRFMAPSSWKTAYRPQGLVASKYAPWCPQMDGMSVSGDEDCLFLNIWRPHGASPGDNLTVMVWIYGGAFVSGDGGDRGSPNTYDGCGLAVRHGVIVASMNYRLGPLGFAALAAPAGGVDANWGLEDQREALRWLRQQAIGFGGHPGKITIFGESAGAQSVWHHLASQRSAGLFRAAISESGMPSAFGSKYGLNRTASFAGRAGCNETASASLRACLMNKSAAELIMTAADVPGDPERYWGPTIDGIDLMDYPDVLFRQGSTHAVPILAGINTNEGTSFIYPEYPNGMNESQYRAFLTDTLTTGDRPLAAQDMAKVFRKYPPTNGEDLRPLASSLFTDLILCRDLNAIASFSTRTRTFFYRFNHRPTCPRPSSAPGAYHGMELPYVFGTPSTYECSFAAEEQALSTRMQKMWTNFAKYLNPSITDEPFPEYKSTSQKSVVLQTPSDSTDNGYRESFCSVWNEIWESKNEKLAVNFVV